MSGNNLFFSPKDSTQAHDKLTIRLAESKSKVIDGSVVPTLDIKTFRKELKNFTFDQPVDYEVILEWTISQLERGLVHIDHPRYFGLFNPTPTTISQLADRIVSSFNPQLATWTTSPSAVEIEAHVIDAIAKRIGLPDGSKGHFTTGGSEANYTGLIQALVNASPRYQDLGILSFKSRPVFYVSRECHLAWLKIAAQSGLGKSSIRLVATDGEGRLDCAILSKTINDDITAGLTPFLIVATAGTTNAGSIDPLVGCRSIADQFNLWLHVDAAWGGGLIASDGHRHVLNGIETADSITVDAHKWFATTMSCGMFFTRHPGLLSAAFHTSTSFMPSNLNDVDPYVLTAQWSRRFIGLRMFLSLAVAGWNGYGKHIEHSLGLIDLLKGQLLSQNWRVVNDSSVAVLCVLPSKQVSVRKLVNHVLASGVAWISVTSYEYQEVIRICVTSGITTEDDISLLVNALLRAEDELFAQEQK